MKRIMIIWLFLFLFSGCISTREYLENLLQMEENYDAQQKAAKKAGKKINPVWHNPHAFPR